MSGPKPRRPRVKTTRVPPASNQRDGLPTDDRLEQELRVSAALADLYGPLSAPPTSMEAIAGLVLDQARRLTGSAHGFVATIDPVTKDLLAHTLADMPAGQCAAADAERRGVFSRDPDGRYPTLWGHALNTRKSFFTNVPEQHPAAQGASAGPISPVRFLAVPVLFGDELVGQIALANAPINYTDADLSAMERLAEIFAVAVQRTRTEAALRESQAWLQSIFRAAPTGIGLVRDRVFQWVNATLCRMVGYTEGELVGRSARILYPTEDDYAHVGREKYARMRATGQGSVETRWQRKDGVVLDILLSSTLLDPADWAKGVTFTALDITAQKRTEAALRARTEQLEALRATTADITGELELATVLHLVARRACELTGATAADIDLWDGERQILVPEASFGHALRRPPTARRLGEGAMGTVAQTRRGLIIHDYRSSPIAHPETRAHTKITASLVEPLLYRDTLLGVIGVDHETPGCTFTDHDQATLQLFAAHAAIAIQNARLYGEAERRRREAEVLASLARSITASLDPDTVLERVTEGAKSLCEGDVAAIALREKGDLVFRTWAGRVTPRYTALRIREGRGLGGKVLAEERPFRTANYVQDSDITPDFHEVALAERFVAEVGVPIRIEGTVAGVLFVIRRTARPFTVADEAVLTRLADQAAISIANARLFQNQQQAYVELEQAQEELVRSEKLRGLGQMAAGVAHDLNNTLATILGQAELLRLLAHQPEVQEGLRTLVTAATDGAHVVRRLQDFSRQRDRGPLTPCDLKLLVSDLLEITRPRWREEPQRKGVAIHASMDLDGLPPIQGNPAEIREALANLIFNAVDAMPSGGNLRFTGRVCDETGGPGGVSATRGAGSVDFPSQWVELAVSDSGIGMTDAGRRRVFDPFFTTKGLHGTGLGLSAAYGIMERHGGQIEVASAPGEGTTFRLRFRPAAEAARPPLHAVSSAIRVHRILLVDDDAAVRQTLAALLRASGQEVIEADSGAAALTWLETTAVDLVLTDLGMPQVNGWEVARAAKRRRPDLPVVLLTGWGDQTEAEVPEDAGVDQVLTKPVPRSTLLAAIAELVRSRHGGAADRRVQGWDR